MLELFDSEIVDYALETLIDLDGYIIEVGDGHWVKIEARVIQPHINRPQGIKYSLTFHDQAAKEF